MMPMFAWFNLGGGEIVLILLVALLLFGRRLPEVGRSLGQGLVEFKRGLRDVNKDVDSVRREVDEAGRDARAAADDDKPARQA